MSAHRRHVVVFMLLALIPGRADGQETTKPSSRLVTLATDGTMTVTASRTPLHTVLTEISVQTRIPIIFSETLEHARVSATLRGLSFEEVMKRLLEEYDAFYLFGPRGEKPSSIRAIWIYGKGDGETIEPVPAAVWASTKDLKAQVDDPDVAVRTEAIEALIDRLAQQALPFVLTGLADGDEIVRLATLSAASESGIEIPTAELHSLVLNDQSPHVRIAALRAVEGRTEAHVIALGLRHDPDPDIRNQALSMLRPQ